MWIANMFSDGLLSSYWSEWSINVLCVILIAFFDHVQVEHPLPRLQLFRWELSLCSNADFKGTTKGIPKREENRAAPLTALARFNYRWIFAVLLQRLQFISSLSGTLYLSHYLPIIFSLWFSLPICLWALEEFWFVLLTVRLGTHMHCTHARYTCTVHMHSTHAQYTCTVHMRSTQKLWISFLLLSLGAFHNAFMLSDLHEDEESRQTAPRTPRQRRTERQTTAGSV